MDGAATFDSIATIRNEGSENQVAWHDVEYAGGTIVAAGRAGQIVNSLDGLNFFYNKADASLATKDWAAVGLASASEAAVGGQGGALVLTTAANTVPAVPRPPGPIVGPPRPPLTSTNQGASQATIAPVISFTGRGNRLSARIVGRRLRVRMKGAIALPVGANPATACVGKLRLKIRKGTKVMANRTARLQFKRGKCRFAKTITLKRRKVGRTRALRLQVRFLGNTVLKAGTTSRTLVIRK